MDLQTGLACLGFVVLSGAVLFIISVFGIKEKTYEEAMAEQRKLPADALLLGRPKEKAKNKKPNRTQKKVKKKVEEVVKKQSSSDTDEPVTSEPEQHPHVTIVPDPQVLGETPPQPSDSTAEDKRKKKKEKLKPILLNKEKAAVVAAKPAVNQSVNHFEETLPKDDAALRKGSKSDISAPSGSELEENAHQEEVIGEKSPVKESLKKKETSKPSAMAATGAKPATAKREDSLSSSSTPASSSPVQQSKAAKEKKKIKKNEVNPLQLTSADVNLQLLCSLINKADLSRNEVQRLTDLLLNKHLDDRVDHSEWIEGRQDPVVKLKKQLAEREEALANEAASSLAFQNKLKELRTELNGEKSKLSLSHRQYEETVMAKQAEVQSLQNRIHQQAIVFENDKQNYLKNIQQLQHQIQEDNLVMRKLQESGQAQAALQQELSSLRQKIPQLEYNINCLGESEKNLKMQLNAVLAEKEQLAGTYNLEVQKARRLHDELRDARTKLESPTQVEELNRSKKELEKKLSNALQSEEEAKFEKTRLQGEIHQLTNKVSGVEMEKEKVNKEAQRLHDEVRTLTGKISDLQGKEKQQQTISKDITRLQEESKQLQDEVAFFKNENDLLKSQLSAVPSQRVTGDGHENGGKDLNLDFINHENESKQKDAAVERLQAEVASKEKVIEKMKAEVIDLSSRLSALNAELTNYKTDAALLSKELDAQKAKNNDLRQRNWKVMDALSNAEKALDIKTKQTDNIINTQTAAVRAEEQQLSRALLERLFPQVALPEKDYKKWVSSFEMSASSVLAGLTAAANQTPPSPTSTNSDTSELEAQNSQLQSLVTHYKKIIEDTEGMLNKLQKHIEQEELKWGEQLEAKQAEIDTLNRDQASLLDTFNSQLQAKLKSLEESIVQGEAERTRAVSEAEKLSQEVTRLRDQAQANAQKLQALATDKAAVEEKLISEVERSKELNKEVVKLRCNVKIGQDTYEAEHKIRLELEDKLKVVNGGVDGSGSTSVSPAAPAVENPKPRKTDRGVTEWWRQIRRSSRSRRR